MVTAVQVWNPDDWEAFALNLLQSRHGALNVHKIPARHKGDLGIDYFCPKEGVAYQCYAVEEPVDIVIRAERQKKKITTDTGKMVAKRLEVAPLFLGEKIKHWVLLSPLHDSKEVNIHCAKKTMDIRNLSLPCLDPLFEVGIHDQGSFASKAVADAMAGLSSIRLQVPSFTQAQVDQWSSGSPDLLLNANGKLSKRVSAAELDGAVADAAKFFLEGNALMDALRSGSPDLHEKVMSAVSARATRLQFVGPLGGSTPGQILSFELDGLVDSLRTAVPSLSTTNAEQIALATLSEWIMRCPLDFP